MVELCNIEKRFGRKKIINNISFKFENGMYGLLGPNGAGKTTLIRCILGVYSIDSGEVKMHFKKTDISYLPQEMEMFNNFSVFEMLSFYSEIKCIKKEDREIQINQVLKEVNLLEEKNKKIRKLSGGMKRRVGIAQALLGNPKLIILDEPTVGLDPEERNRFKEIIKEYAKSRIIILSTHIVDDLEKIGGHVVLLRDGEIINHAEVKDLHGKLSLEEYYLEQIKGC